MTLEQIHTMIVKAANTAAARAGTVAAPIELVRRQDAHYNVGGFRTTCPRTATWCKQWMASRKLAHTDFGRPMDPFTVTTQDGIEIRVYQYTIGD